MPDADAMKKFTSRKIAERIVRNFLRKENVRESLNDSTVQSLINATAEEFAEGMRYDEYLTRENVWDYMRNVTSAIGTGRMLGYTPRRKRSAVGTVTFAVDPNITRIGAFEEEVYTETLREDGTVDTLNVEPGVVDFSNLRSLRHFSGAGTDPSIEIPAYTVIQDAESDIRFMTLETVVMRTADSLEEDQDFETPVTSRWARVRALQGRERIQTARGLRGREFERVSINSRFVEDMGMPYTEDFLDVKVKLSPAGDFEPWKYITDIREASPYDRVFTIQTSRDYSRVDIVFGNGITGKKVARGADVQISYLETLGTEGNIDESHRLTEIRTTIQPQVPGAQLFVTNMAPIMNGADEDTIEDIKARAPGHYLTVESVGSERAYREVIEALPEIRTSKVYRATYRNNQEGVFRDAIGFTAITEEGTAPRALEIVRRVRDSIGDAASPTDILQYDPPEIINAVYNVRGEISDVTRPLQHFVNEIRRAIYNKFRITNMGFKDAIYHVDVVQEVKNKVPEFQSGILFPEAIIEEEFYIDEFMLGEEGALRTDFNFRTSLAPFREIENNVIHLLRVDFIVDYSPLQHRSRSILIVTNEDGDYEVRQFGLLGDIVMTPEVISGILNDTSGLYSEKTRTVWNWINRTELSQGDPDEDDPEDFDFYFDENNEIQLSSYFQENYVDGWSPNNYSILEETDAQGVGTGTVYLFYTEVIDVSDMDFEDIQEYYERYEEWQEAEWAQDPDVLDSMEEQDYIGTLPRVYAPDSTHKAPIEITFVPGASGEGDQAGSGTIRINEASENFPVAFIPDIAYRGIEEDGEPADSKYRIIARPLSWDLVPDQDFEILNIEQDKINIDLRYRTEDGSEFQTATDFEDIDEGDS